MKCPVAVLPTLPTAAVACAQAAGVKSPACREVIGVSVEARALEAFTFGDMGEAALILGGVHGDEPKGVYLAHRFIDLLFGQPGFARGRRVTIVPVVNPDGYARRRRRNANKVDLNRNCPTSNWASSKPRSRYYSGSAPAGEPETRAVIELIRRLQPRHIVSIHSIGEHRFCNNYDGPARELAEAMSAGNGYPVIASMGYCTPGSLGTWAGVERGIPTITLELPAHHSRERCWRDNRQALLTVATVNEQGGEI
ncbi:MAG: DUF2817 domain-containing protein [Phycisphaerae bacterium]|nr:DUF2817 domain-containing protein [Phycisphaerae bacterium]